MKLDEPFDGSEKVISLSDDMVALLNNEQLDDDDSAIDIAKGHHRQGTPSTHQGKDPGQGRHPSRSAAFDLCRQAAGVWPGRTLSGLFMSFQGKSGPLVPDICRDLSQKGVDLNEM